MKPVDQTVHGALDGNCLSACVASILELSIEEVPNFMDDLPPWTPDDDEASIAWTLAFLASINGWLRPRGFAYFEIGLPEGESMPAFLTANVGHLGYWFLMGEIVAGTGAMHSVVMRGPEMVHDPNPRRAGLATAQAIGLLVPLDPATLNPQSRLPVADVAPIPTRAVPADYGWRSDAPPVGEWVIAWVRGPKTYEGNDGDGGTENWTPAILRLPEFTPWGSRVEDEQDSVDLDGILPTWHFTYEVRERPELEVLAWKPGPGRPAFLAT